MSHILCVGIATLDIINYVPHYPREDEELRARAQRIAPGGNAANTATMLGQLGHKAVFVGTLADDEPAKTIRDNLNRYGANTDHCPVMEGRRSPVSYITLSEANGSRTIVHYRDLPELTAAQFTRLDITGYDWFHFEGRNVGEVQGMIEHVRARRVDQPLSIEIEKEREGLDQLLALADVLIFSRAFVRGRGHEHPEAFFRQLRRQLPETLFVAPWGEDGAYAQQPGQPLVHSPAQPPERIVDTVGAGDTFNAGLIHALASGRTLAQALSAAVQLAGIKIGLHGFDGMSSS